MQEEKEKKGEEGRLWMTKHFWIICNVDKLSACHCHHHPTEHNDKKKRRKKEVFVKYKNHWSVTWKSFINNNELIKNLYPNF